MSQHDSQRPAAPPTFFLLPLAGRVVGLDLARGFAIFAMTAYHQSLVIRPDGDWRLFADFLGFLAAPFFLAMAGAAAAFHERRHRWPLKLIVHGGLLFALAYSVDLVAHRSWRMDWDVFQVIGGCYVGLGLLDSLGGGRRKLAALAAVLAAMALLPALRPDQGVFPPWPFGGYFVAGWLLARLGLVQGLRRWQVVAAAGVGFIYFVARFSWDPTPDRTSLGGGLFLLALTWLLLLAALAAEKRELLKTRVLAPLVRWGQFPLTLYFVQQFAAVARLRLPLPLPPTCAWMAQTAVLLATLYAATLFMERYGFLDLGWWLRQAEQRILPRTPAGGRFGPRGAAQPARRGAARAGDRSSGGGLAGR